MRRVEERSRSGAKLRRRPIIYIFCEGEETEPVYFRRFKSRNSNLEIRPVVSQNKSAPHLVAEAKKYITRYESYYPDDGDQIWCVFDRDSNTDEAISKAGQLANKYGYQIAFSNPAFELWFLLHFFDQNAPVSDGAAIIRKLESNGGIKHYSKSKDYYSILKPLQPEALSRARQLIKKHEANGNVILSRDSNPVTTVSDLVTLLNEKMQLE